MDDARVEHFPASYVVALRTMLTNARCPNPLCSDGSIISTGPDPQNDACEWCYGRHLLIEEWERSSENPVNYPDRQSNGRSRSPRLVYDYKKIIAYINGEIPVLWHCRHETANGCKSCRDGAAARDVANLSGFQHIEPAMSLLGLWAVAQRERADTPPVVSRQPVAYMVEWNRVAKCPDREFFTGVVAHNQAKRHKAGLDENGWLDAVIVPLFADVEPKRRIPMTAETFREILVPELEAMQANTEAAQEPDEAIGIARAIEFIRSIEIDGGKPYSDDAPKGHRP